MVSSDEKYRGYDITIEFEGHIPSSTSYGTMFYVVKGGRRFALACRFSSFIVLEGRAKEDDVPNILRKEGLKRVYELIDSQQFENGKTYKHEISYL